MASKTTTILGLLALNLLSFAAVQACEPNCSQPLPRWPPPAVSSPSGNCCSIKTLQLKVCANVLNAVELGVPPAEHCYSLIAGLVDLEAAVCVCAAVRANVPDIVGLDVEVGVSLLLNHCGKSCTPDFTCSR